MGAEAETHKSRSSSVIGIGPDDADSEGRYNKLIYFMLAVLVLYVFARGSIEALTKGLSYDEVLTLAVASQPGLRRIWHALATAVDTQGPGFYAIERVALGLVTNVHYALRLPSIIAMGCSIICVFAYARKYSGTWIAFLSATLLLSTSLFSSYAANARSYSTLLACVAFALVCYQRLPSLHWTILFGLSLTLAQCLHYYSAIFVVLLFGVAESVFLLKESRFRWGVWLALAASVLCFCCFWPLLSAIKNYYGAHYWSHFGVSDLPKAYGYFLLTSAGFATGIVAICMAGVVGSQLRTRFDSCWAEVTGDELAEDTLILGLLTLPFIVFVATKLAGGGMADRYSLAAVFGIPLGIARIFSRVETKTAALLAFFIFSSVGIHEVSFWRSVHSIHLESQTAEVEHFVQQAGRPELPVVISDGLTYVPFTYYASTLSKQRFVYLADPEKALENTGTDNLDKSILALRRYLPLNVQDLAEFVKFHSMFLLYAQEPASDFDWLPRYFGYQRASLQVIAIEQNRRLYLVTMKMKEAQR